MRLREIAIRGFQSYRVERCVEVEPDITVVAGRNNVGKSALFRALLVWQEPQEGVASDFRLTYTWDTEHSELAKAIEDLGQVSGWHPVNGRVRLSATVEANSAGSAQASDLRISQLGLQDLVTTTGQNGREVWRGLPSPANSAAIASLERLARDLASNVIYVAPRKIELRPGQHVYSQTTLRPDGENLANVLRHVRDTDPRRQWSELMAFIQDAFPEIEDLTVPSVPDQSTGQGEPIVYYRGIEDGVPLRLSGTGLQQLLALAVALLGATASQLVLIDEPQAYLHPHAERALARLIAHKSQHQYLIATHSSTL